MIATPDLGVCLAAAAASGAVGIGLDQVARALADVRRIPGRLERVPSDSPFEVFVDYAHTDDALKNVLSALRELTRRHLIVVFGCGGDRDKTKRPAMGRVASRLADYSVLTSDNPRTEKPDDIIDDIRAGFGTASSFEVVEDRRGAIRRALELADEGDVVLIAGKGHETFQEFEKTTVSFDDRQIVKMELGVD